MEPKIDYITGDNFGEYWIVVAEFYHGKFMSPRYPDLLMQFLKRLGVKKVLDAACGIGEPSLDVVEKGFPLSLSDGDASMLGVCQARAKERGLDIPIFHSKWIDLPKKTKEIYDAVLCLDSSITYVNTWAQGEPAISINRARYNILESLKAFYDILAPGGYVVIGLAKYAFEDSDELIIDYGTRLVEGVPVHHIWKLKWDFATKIKSFTLIFKFAGKTHVKEMLGYMLLPNELKTLLRKAGFPDISIQEIALGEYDNNFVAQKLL